MESQEVKFFKETFDIVYSNVKKYQYRLKTHKFSRVEKALLNSIYSYRKGDIKLALESIVDIHPQKEFYKATRFYLLGLFQNHLGKYRFAKENFEMALEIYEKFQDQTYMSYCYYGLILVCANTKEKEDITTYLNELEAIKPNNDYARLCRVHGKALCLHILNRNLECLKLLSFELDQDNQYLKYFETSFLLLIITSLISEREFVKAELYLEKYKKGKGISVKANYKFLKILLSYIIDQAPLYIYKRDFEYSIELYDQLMVVKCLSEGDISEAQKAWARLSLHNTDLYKEGFNYNNEGDLFGIVLESFQSIKPVASIIDLSEIKKPIDKVFKLLTESSMPLDKYEIIEKVWNELPNESNGLKLRKIISKIRKEYCLEIKSYKNTYQVIKKEVS